MRDFHDLNPIAVTVYFLTVTAISMFTMNAFLILISAFGALLFSFSITDFQNLKGHIMPFLVFAVTALINPFVSHNGATVLFVLNNNPVTLESFIYGLVMAAMIVGILYWFRIFSKIMTSDKLIYVFGALSPKAALLISLSLRYIPYFSSQVKKVANAQKALGLYKEDNIVDRIKGGMRVFSVMVTWVLENGIITADSMTARGYGIGKRSRFSLFSWKKGDILLLILTLSLSLFSVLLLKNTYVTYYPHFKIPSFDIQSYLGYALYFILTLLPTIIHIKEAVKWRFLRSKI